MNRWGHIVVNSGDLATKLGLRPYMKRLQLGGYLDDVGHDSCPDDFVAAFVSKLLINQNAIKQSISC